MNEGKLGKRDGERKCGWRKRRYSKGRIRRNGIKDEEEEEERRIRKGRIRKVKKGGGKKECRNERMR